MKVKVKFFASLKQYTRRDSAEIEIKRGWTTKELIEALKERFGKNFQLERGCAIAVNGIVIKEKVALKDGDEIAFLPPVSGGIW